MRRLTLEFVAHHGIANSLVAKLNAAEEAEARGDMSAKEGALRAYANQLRAQSGKALTAAQATFLINLASTR
jgi:hypothetical protein